MNKRLLILVPLGLLAIYLGVQALIPAGSTRDHFFVAEVATAKALGVVGCLVAALGYRRGEYLNIAWLLLGLDYVLLVMVELMFGRVVHLPWLSPAATTLGKELCVLVGNLGAGIGALMLARVWRVAGMMLPGSKLTQRLLMLLAIVGAGAIVGVGIWKDLQAFLAGDRSAVIAIVSDIGDFISFSVIAPFLLTAIAMRGGALAWPWGLLSASNVAWLFYDMVWSFELSLPFSNPTVRTIAESFRLLGCALTLSAGFAQRRAIRSAARDE